MPSVSNVDLVVKVSGVSNERIVLQLFFMLMLKRPVEEAKMSAQRRPSPWLSPGAIHARLQGAEGVTLGNEHTSTRTNGERKRKQHNTGGVHS